jgi:hypothetical protein
MAASGEEIEIAIFEWLARRYPDGPNWMDPEFDALREIPTEIRMIPIFSAIEYNIGNGGWAQFLWNCFGCWREMLDVAEQGYLLIGAHDQQLAVAKLRANCARDEAECEAILSDSSEDGDGFAEFTMRSYLSLATSKEEAWQVCLMDASSARHAWLEVNEALVRGYLRQRLDA